MILKAGTFSIHGKSPKHIMGWGVPLPLPFYPTSGYEVSGSGTIRRGMLMVPTNGSPAMKGERFAVMGKGHSWKAPGFAAAMGGLARKKEMGRNWVHGQGVGRAGVEEEMGSEEKKEHCPNPNPKPRLLTLPTILTIGRVGAVPLLVTTFYMNGWWATTATTSIFLLAAITDWLDGYLARRMRLGTPFGAFLDPVADKLMVAATLVLLCSKPFEVTKFGHVPWLLTIPSIAIIGREITMSAVREWAASQNSSVLEAVAVNNLGKWKTATQMTALTILLASRDCSQGVIAASGVVLLYTSAGLAIWSLVVYMRGIWRILLK